MDKANVRCAIYTRKSSEEGLEHSFNSLEAQREACRAYILSQRHEGWTVLATLYDDGGISGGTMERPGLQQLLSDIQSGKIDTVVVYKVDRLTRSLMDFSKIIEIFDSRSVSFVSVTQHFNTTSSMGRLTLNVLLSFAQFEREITGERIRDKIAASKKKGMWMGGSVPLGYDNVNRRLVVNPAEAESVRTIFREYVRLGCVSKLKQFLKDQEIRTINPTAEPDQPRAAIGYSRGALYHLLRNRIYLGETVHRAEFYKGQHEPIVPQELWDQVEATLKKNNRACRTGRSRSTPSLLSGKLFDENGIRFTPTHAVKSGRRYRYYTSQAVVEQVGAKPTIARFPAQEIEQLVMTQVRLLIDNPEKHLSAITDDSIKSAFRKSLGTLERTWPNLKVAKQQELAASILNRVVIGENKLTIHIGIKDLLLTSKGSDSGVVASSRFGKSDILTIEADFSILRRGGELRVIAPPSDAPYQGAPIRSLLRVVARARDWHDRIIAGEISTVDNLARQSGLTRRYVRRVLQLANLSPRITEALVEGRHRPNLVLKEIMNGLPLDWTEQEKKLS